MFWVGDESYDLLTAILMRNLKKTLGYKNVVIMSGTNDLKTEMDNEEEEILNIYQKYKAKFEKLSNLG